MIPPSEIKCPLISTGLNKDGIAPLAETACGNEPRSNKTSSPVSILVPIQKNGIGNSLKLSISSTGDIK